MSLVEGIHQYYDARYVESVALAVIKKAGAGDNRARILALRDYLHANTSYQGAPQDDRPFLRDSAADTLRSGKGYCGEVTRAFVCLADSIGIRAQRVNLWGTSPHVVAEAELAPGDRVLVDCQNPPQIADLERLDDVIANGRYEDYYNLNLRRLRISWLVSRVKIEMGAFSYWTENPHALKSILWLVLAATILIFWIGIKLTRSLLQFILYKRGWIHLSNREAIMAAVKVHSGELKVSEWKDLKF